MASRQRSLTKATIKRAIEAATSAGLIVSALKIDVDGSVRMSTVSDETGPSQSTACDLEKWMASHAHTT